MYVKRVGLFNKETSDEFVIVRYIKINICTSTEIVYVGCNRRSLEICVSMTAIQRYMTRLNGCPREQSKKNSSICID